MEVQGEGNKLEPLSELELGDIAAFLAKGAPNDVYLALLLGTQRRRVMALYISSAREGKGKDNLSRKNHSVVLISGREPEYV